MSDAPPPPPGAPASTGGGGFCGDCGAALPPGATFCGTCGAPTAAGIAASAAASAPPDDPGTGGASTWTGVQPVVERPGGSPTPTPPPPPGADGPPPSGPAPGGPPPLAAGGGGKSKGPLIAIIALVVAALGVGGFLLLGGDDDEAAGDDTTTTEDPDGTTTTEDPDGTTTTTDPEGTTTTTEGGGEPIDEIDFVPITDDTGVLTVQVPSDWTDVSTAPLGGGLVNVQASTDRAAFLSGFEVPGMSFSLFPSAPPDVSFDNVLDFLAASVNLPDNCTSQGKEDYEDGVFTGRFEVWSDCAGIGTQLVLISAAQEDGRMIEVNVQLTADDPVEIATRIAETFLIIG